MEPSPNTTDRPVESDIHIPAQKSSKKYFYGVLGALFIIILSSIMFLMGRNSTIEKNLAQAPTATQTPSPSLPPTTSISTTPGNLSFAYVNNELHLKYNNIVYKDQNQYDPQPTTVPEDTVWIDIQAPILKEKPIASYEGLFDFKNLSQKRFVFVMRWDGVTRLYYYDSSNSLKELLMGSQSNQEYYVIKIQPKDTFSKDQKTVALHMFECWQCGGHVPETVLVKLDSGISKRIGRVSEFNWLEGNAYNYKEYKTIPCGPEVQIGECSEKPETLPSIDGSFE